MGASQRHKREVHGRDAQGFNSYSMNDRAVPKAVLVQNLAGQTIDFKKWYPRGTNFTNTGSLPAGMTLNAGTGIVSGTPTTVSGGQPIINITQLGGDGVTTTVFQEVWEWSVSAP